MKFRTFLFAIFLSAVAFLLPACCDDEQTGDCLDHGFILGADPRDCACCGGWFIEIGEDTLRANNLPEAFVQTLNISEFPLAVHLDWEYDATPCLGDEIEVSCIKKD